MGRRDSRQALFSLLYEYDIQGEKGSQTLETMGDILDKSLDNSDRAYIEKGLDCYVNHIQAIDDMIKSSCKSWNLDRMSRVDVSLIRLAIIEMMFFDDIPHKVSINEAVELAKIYSADKAPKFINGVLAGCYKTINECN